MKNEVKPRLYDVLAKAFAQERVRTCFALLGDANMNWASRLSEEGCRMVYVGTSIARSLPPWRTRERTGMWASRP